MSLRPFIASLSCWCVGIASSAPFEPQAHPMPAKKAVAKSAPVKMPVIKKPQSKKPLAAKPGTKVLPVPAERKAVQAKYDAMSLLVMRRDGAKLAQFFMGMTTPDFVYRDKKGRKLNRAQLVQQLKTQMRMVKAFKRSGNKVAGFAMKGPMATARVISDFAMVFPNGAKTVTVAGQSTTDDTWVKTASGWKLRGIRTLRESVKYNGKPV